MPTPASRNLVNVIFIPLYIHSEVTGPLFCLIAYFCLIILTYYSYGQECERTRERESPLLVVNDLVALQRLYRSPLGIRFYQLPTLLFLVLVRSRRNARSLGLHTRIDICGPVIRNPYCYVVQHSFALIS